MLLTLIQKEILHHILSVRFVTLFFMCALLIPFTLIINYHNYLQRLTDYQEAIKLARTEAKETPPDAQNPNTEVSKFFLKPTPLSVFANGLEEVLPSYLGMTRNGVRQGIMGLSQAPLSYAMGNFDFLFLISTVFSLLALLFTFDAVTGEREIGTLRITLANALPRDLFLWSKLIGGGLVFLFPFLVSFLFGLLLLVSQGFPLGEDDIFPRVISLMVVSLLYIVVFFTIGVAISTYLDSVRTSLIIAFAFWVFAVLIAPRAAFLAAKLIAPTRTEQTIYMEKTVVRNNLAKEKEDKITKKMLETMGDKFNFFSPDVQEKLDELREPIDEEYNVKFKKRFTEINQSYQREKYRQERVGEILSRLTPTSSLIYLAMNLTQTGKEKRNAYFQTAEQYYSQIYDAYFKNISDDQFSQLRRLTSGVDTSKDAEKILQPPDLIPISLKDTLMNSVVDTLLLCLFIIVLTTVAFLKFFHSDI